VNAGPHPQRLAWFKASILHRGERDLTRGNSMHAGVEIVNLELVSECK
jgi:hypothetical protein